MTVADRIAAVRAEIAAAALRAGRNPGDITLLAASKTRSPEEMAEAAAAGADALGENRAQEFRDKRAFVRGAPYHFIGRLQQNKLKYLVGHCDLIHSVDSAELLESIDRLAAERNVTQDILCQVNIGRELQKGGVLPEDLSALLEKAEILGNIRFCGLMCIPPEADEERLSGYFCEMRKLYVDIRTVNMDNGCTGILSMGMSGDYILAVEHGSTLVRVGSAIFGEREHKALGADE